MTENHQTAQARVQAERRNRMMMDAVHGLMVTEPGTLPVSLQERDLAEQIRNALREADQKQWEYAKVPCCVLRDVYDRIMRVDTSQRHTLLGTAHIGNTYGAHQPQCDEPDASDEDDEEII